MSTDEDKIATKRPHPKVAKSRSRPSADPRRGDPSGSEAASCTYLHDAAYAQIATILRGRGAKYDVEEREAIGLCIALEAVDDIVNHALLEVRELRNDEGEATVQFPTRILLWILDPANGAHSSC